MSMFDDGARALVRILVQATQQRGAAWGSWALPPMKTGSYDVAVL